MELITTHNVSRVLWTSGKLAIRNDWCDRGEGLTCFYSALTIWLFSFCMSNQG